MISDALSLLLAPTSPEARNDIAETIARYYPPHLIDLLAEKDIRVRALAKRERYDDASSALRKLGVNVDSWPVAPAGLFVVEERTLYLRDATVMTTIHELGHGLDCALGDGIYLSGYDKAIRRAFANARDFVSSYSATGHDEFFAEAVRAFCSANDDNSPWPAATPERLRDRTPEMYGIVHGIFHPGLAPVA